ncbi:MAG: TadE family protein [Pirellulaceae bacterium]|nr:TadE family protein [Pirellulaceae bacterium]
MRQTEFVHFSPEVQGTVVNRPFQVQPEVPTQIMPYKCKNSERSRRPGAAMIEFAICMPVFFLIAMGTIETCRMIYLRQSLKLAAYECARVGIMPGMTPEVLKDQCDVILGGRRVRNYQLVCTPTNPADLKFGELFKVTVNVSAEENALIRAWFYQKKILSESVSIMAER